MSTTIDNKVVEMQFDNRQFERGVSQSMSTLDKLKQKLNFSGATRGLKELGDTARRTDMSGLAKGVEVVQAKFSALQVAGITALSNITNSAVNAGKRIASALTIDPIKTGFQEYETQMGAIQTILANTQSKGSTLQDVNAALDELNTYADKTIYNFTEMTRNIGTFTAAGVDLEKSVTSIKGIANLAAVSGSTSQQASMAMYQLSQALAAGRVSLMDWNSVVNAGMGGEVFQNALKRTARQMGKNVDEAIAKYGSFRESLTQGEWLTTEVLTETLTQLSGAYTEADLIAQGYTESQAKEITKLAETAVGAATKVKTFTQLVDTVKEAVQSGWSQSWRIIVGDFEEAKELFTSISDAMGDIIGKSADARNKLLTEGLATGWRQLISKGITDEEGFKDTIKNVAKEHGVAIDQMITDEVSFEKSLKQGWLTGDILTESLGKMTEKVNGLSVEQRKEMGYTAEQVKHLNDLNDAVKRGEINMDDFAKKMTMASGRENIISGLTKIFQTLGAVLKPIQEAFREIFPALKGEQLYAFTEKFKEFTDKLKVTDTMAGKIKSTFKGLFSVIDIGVQGVKALAKGFLDLLKHFKGIGGKALDAGESIGDFLSNLRDLVIEGNLFGKTVDKIVGFLGKAIDKVKEFGKSVGEMVDASSVVDGLVGAFKGLWNVVKTVGSTIGKVVKDVFGTIVEAFANGDIFDVINSGLFAGVLMSIKKFFKGVTDQVDNIKFIDKIKEVLDGVRDSLSSYQDKVKAEALMKIAGAVGILAASLYVISGIDSDKLANSLGAVGIMMGELIGAMALLGKVNTGSLSPLKGIVGSLANISQMISMMGLGAAVLILAGAMRTIASLDWDQVDRGLIGIAGMVGILVAAARLMNTESKSITKFGGQMILLSSAVAILAGVAKIIGSMNGEQFGTAIGGIMFFIGSLVAAAKIMDTNDRAITKFAGQMMTISLAVGALAGVAKLISTMSLEEMGKGGAGILGLVTMLVAASKIMNSGKGGTVQFAGQMALLATAINLLVPPFMVLGHMNLDSILQALISLSGAMVVLGLGLKVMSGSLSGAAALMVAATAVMMLTAPLKILGSMDLNSILQALIAMAGTFVVLGVGGLALAPIIPAILGLAGAITLLSLSAVGFGAGVLAISAGFSALALSGAAGATALVAAFGTIITGLLGLVPQIAEIIGHLIVEVARILGEYTPQLVVSLLQFISGILGGLAEYGPQIVDSLLTFAIGIINGLAEHAPALIEAVMNLVGSILKGVIDQISQIDTTSLVKGIAAVGIMAGMMYVLSGVAGLIPSAMAGLLGVGLCIGELTAILAALGAINQIPGLDWLIHEGGELLQNVGNAIGKMVGGLIGGIGEGVSASLPAIATNLSNFMMNLTPFLMGASIIDPSIVDSVGSLAKAIMLLTAADLVESLVSFFTGGNSFEQFAQQIVPLGEGIRQFGESVAGVDTEAITASAQAARALVGVLNELPNEGGVAGFIFGDQDLSGFAENIAPLGHAMKAYGDAVAGVNAEAITNSVPAAQAIVKIAESIPTEFSSFTNPDTINTFSTNLSAFGKALKDYSITVLGVSADAISNSATATNSLLTVVKSMSGIDSTGVEQFVNALNKLATVDLAGVVNAFSSAGPSMTNAGATLINSLVQGIQNGSSKLTGVCVQLISSAVSKIRSYNPTFNNLGSTLMKQFVNGLDRNSKQARTVVMSALQSASSGIRTHYSGFYQGGVFLGEGLAAGIRAKEQSAYNAGFRLGQAAVRGERAGQQSHSPSVLMIQSGKWIGEGLVIGMNQFGKKVYSTGKSLGQKATDAVSTAVSMLATTVDADMDVSPTIRPVVDLSDMRSGIRAIDSMINQNPALGLDVRARAVSSSMSRSNQNGTANDIVTAINRLRKEMGEVGGTTYNVNGITYDDGSNITDAVKTLVRAARVERRI